MVGLTFYVRFMKRIWKCGKFELGLEGNTPLIMGILNVTPDSFSDGGHFFELESAVRHVQEMQSSGADIIDVGGESTRPGADSVGTEEEIRRVVPVIEAVSGFGVPISVDTFKAETARRALEAGASIINDISGLEDDESMLDVVVSSDAGVVVMHKQGVPSTMQNSPHYDDIVSEVTSYLKDRVELLVSAGIAKDRICVDPGIGFGKLLEHNIALLQNIDILNDATDCPVLVGLSRKSMLGSITGRDVEKRLGGSLGGLCYCMTHGVDVMRVHDVMESVDAAKVFGRLNRS